jgi:hypothetical protein
MDDRLPILCKKIFAFLTVLSLVSAGIAAVSIVVMPIANSAVHFWIGATVPPGELRLRDNSGSPSILITGLQAMVSGRSDAGLVSLARYYFMPLGMLYALFTALLFDLLRRLFRNVELGSSFTPQTVRLVRYIGISLLIFALVSAAAEAYASQALLDYLCQHVSSPALRWGGARNWNDIWTAASSVRLTFLGGLLVLALSEVFRQGLKLKNDCDLTI